MPLRYIGGVFPRDLCALFPWGMRCLNPLPTLERLSLCPPTVQQWQDVFQPGAGTSGALERGHVKPQAGSFQLHS